MTIPVSSTFPVAIDTNQNLYQVHDALRVRLAEDYIPGDTIITVMGDESMMRRFNATGIITLTEQCSKPELRGISFYYGLRTLTTFEKLELLPGFVDTPKPKNLTDVTQNVMDVHHNALKNALIAIEKFAGKKGEAPLKPLEGTMEQRISYLRKLALPPKAWFKVDKTIGLAPLTVEFEDQSFRLATDGGACPHPVKHLWDFGDNTGPSIITIDEDTEVPSNITNVLVNDVSGGTIKKTYTKPGIYTVTLTVTNEFGSDTVIFDDLINARFPAPDFAVIDFVQRAGQILTPGLPTGGPYTTPPKIRATTNSIIDLAIPAGINLATGRTYGGEAVSGTNTPIDPIRDYTWSFSDDLTHNNSSSARAVFSVGGVYDLNLRVDTDFGAYRITSYHDSFDIVEKANLWLWTYNDALSVSSSEFGLVSETFKTKSVASLTLDVNESFLTGQANETQQKREFRRNNGFAQRGSTPSGLGGVGILYWASGRAAAASPTTEEIRMSEFNGFVGTYSAKPPLARPWNWIGLASTEKLYFALGGVTSAIAPNTSPTNQTKDIMQLNNLTFSSASLGPANYKNGADELTSNEVSYDFSGNPEQGHMSVYRSAWHNDTGFFLRNEGVGSFFRIKSFYKTSGNSSEPFQDIRKLPDMIGAAKVEGQLVSLSQGVYFFSNSGAVAAYNPTSGIWGTGGPGANSASFRLLQDTSVIGFDDASQTLLAASDGDRVAYLSFDYSPKAFIKFNETDTTFSGVTSRPTGTQWQMAIF